MKEYKTIRYKCEICGNSSYDKETIKKCESRSITQDKGSKVGDIILITSGNCAGYKAKVTDIFVYEKDWGHYAWEKYWHTVGLNADIIDHYGSRQLTFDSYEVIK